MAIPTLVFCQGTVRQGEDRRKLIEEKKEKRDRHGRYCSIRLPSPALIPWSKYVETIVYCNMHTSYQENSLLGVRELGGGKGGWSRGMASTATTLFGPATELFYFLNASISSHSFSVLLSHTPPDAVARFLSESSLVIS